MTRTIRLLLPLLLILSTHLAADEARGLPLGFRDQVPGAIEPAGDPHRYFFKLYALDQAVGLEAGAAKEELLTAMEGHTLEEAVLMGTYQRE